MKNSTHTLPRTRAALTRAARGVRWAALFATITVTSATIAAAANVSGRVTTTNGVGIPGIDIDVIDADGVSLDLVDDDTDTDGSYDFIVPDGRYRIRFEAVSGEPLVSREFVNWPLVGFIADFRVEMEVGVRLTGTVVGPTSTPVDGADLSLRRTDTDEKIHSPDDETDASGAFSVVVPSNVELRVTVEPPSAGRLLARRVDVSVGASATSTGVIELETGSLVTGRVTAGGVGVGRANLDAFDVDGVELPLGSDRTDAGGGYAIALPNGTYRLVARPREHLGLAAGEVTVSVSGDVSAPDVVLSTGWPMSGTVRDDLGEGVADVGFELREPGGAEVPLAGGRSNAAGDFLLVAPPGDYDLHVRAPAFRGLAEGVVEDLHVDGPLTFDVDLVRNTPILGVSGFDAQGFGTSAVLTWTVDDLARFAAFSLHRVRGLTETELAGGWFHSGSSIDGLTVDMSASGATFRFTASEHRSGDRYRLMARRTDGRLEMLGPIPTSESVPATGPRLAVSVSPNPARDHLIIRLATTASGEGAPSAALYDVTGRLVMRLGRPRRSGDGWAWRLDGADLDRFAVGSPVYVDVHAGEHHTGVRWVRR